MSEQDDKPPQTETTKSGGDTAVKQEGQAPEPTEPEEGGEETPETEETAETDDGESADDEAAPELTEPDEEDTAEESESASETEEQAKATETAATSEDAQTEGGEQQPLSPDLERHTFEGEVRDNGRLVGYHHREGGEDHGDAKVIEGTKGTPDENGVYEASWTTDDSSREKYSTFFPDDYSQDDVRGAIREAWNNQTPTGVDDQWRGVTSDGIAVEGYVGSGKSVADSTEDDITTAYPLLRPQR